MTYPTGRSPGRRPRVTRTSMCRGVSSPRAAPGTCPGKCTLPSGVPSVNSPVHPPIPKCRERGSAQLSLALSSPSAPRSSAARRWKSMSVCSRAARPSSERCPVISGGRGRGREGRLSAGSVLHVFASGGAACRCRSGDYGGQGWLAAPLGRIVPQGVGLIARHFSSAGRPGPGRCD